MLKILHANSNVLMHNGLKAICSKGGGIQSIEQAKTEEDLRQSLNRQSYDIVILDPHSEHGFSMETAIKIREGHPEQPLLVISRISKSDEVLHILEKGTHGYLTYECDEDEIIHAIFAIAKGEKFYCNKVLDLVLNKHLYGEEENCEPTSLTQRETEVAQFLAEGLTNKEVAKALHLSPHTVHTHRKNIMKKLGVRSIAELTRYAMSTGLIQA